MKILGLVSVLLLNFAVADEHQLFNRSNLNSDSFFEQFSYESLEDSSWVKSRATTFDEGTNRVMEYVGKWALEPAIDYPVLPHEKGLVLKSRAAHHAISRTLPNKFDNTDVDLVLQYEITLQEGLECGGAYIKLLDWQENLGDYINFNSKTPFQVMFGPDVCGANNKIHFIINRESPITHKVEEKHMTNPPLARINDLTTLYTLIIKKNQDFEIRVNGKVAKAGNLLDDGIFEPSLTPPEKIDDENDMKPWLWDDGKYIPDPERSEKPDDYDQKYASHEIPDPQATKPEDWLESEPMYITNPDFEDGYGSMAKILNPKCLNVSGCGPWEPPMINNENYKGPWIQPTIENPNYEGEWSPRKIDNPEYYEDKNPSNLKAIGGIGFELWSMNQNILFNNIYLGHSIEEAEYIGNSTWKIKNKLQDKLKRYHDSLKATTYPQPGDIFELQEEELIIMNRIKSFVHMILMYQYHDLQKFWKDFTNNPFLTIETYPYKFIVYNLLFVFLISILIGVMSIIACFFSDPTSQETPYELESEKDIEKEEDDDEEDDDEEEDNVEAEDKEEKDGQKEVEDKDVNNQDDEPESLVVEEVLDKPHKLPNEKEIENYFNNDGVNVDSLQSVTKRKI